MSHLSQMRQRIKAIQTIKKITDAMRLISMSTHSRMKPTELSIDLYKNKIHYLFNKAIAAHPNYHNDMLHVTTTEQKRDLSILIGSQKGLCGSFNNMLFQLFNNHIIGSSSDNSIITVGKRATTHIQKNNIEHLIASYNNFAIHNLLTVANNLLHMITKADLPWHSVTIYSNKATSFFIQKPIATQIIPFNKDLSTSPIDHEKETYAWEQNKDTILDFLTHQCILSQLQEALFQSLFAEHAARFISMDSSTRNAENLLEQMQRDYNKLRQTKITRELSELSSFFLS